MGFWLNQDGLPVQFGTDKAISELGGDYLVFGDSREFESYIPLGATAFGPAGTLSYPGTPSSFSGTSTFKEAGIVSRTGLFPLQPTAPVTVADGNGLLTIKNPQLYISQVDLEVLVAANAGTGGATGLTGIGLVTVNPATPAFVQVTPNAGVQFVGAVVNANMTAGKHWTWYADGTAIGSSNPPTAGSWLGAVPLVTNSITPLPTNGFVSAIVAGGTYSGASGGGLLRLRVRYNWYGSINQ